jgi:hypothetical protein
MKDFTAQQSLDCDGSNACQGLAFAGNDLTCLNGACTDMDVVLPGKALVCTSGACQNMRATGVTSLSCPGPNGGSCAGMTLTGGTTLDCGESNTGCKGATFRCAKDEDCSVTCHGREVDTCVDLAVDGEAARSLSVEFAIAGGQIMTDSRQRYWGAHIGTAGAKGAAIRCPGTESGGPCSIKCVGSENSGAPGRFGHMYQRTGVPSQLCHSMTVNASRAGPAPVVSVACIGRGSSPE